MLDNVVGTTNLLEAIRRYAPEARVLVTSSCEIYGRNQYPVPSMDEEHPCRPVSPYAVSKLAQDALALMYARTYRMRVIVSRLFNCVNPRKMTLFSTSFARQVAEIEAGKRHELVHGNLDSSRTLLDIRDVCDAYWTLMNRGVPGEAYNIGAERAVSVREFLDMLASRSTAKMIVRRKDETLLRPADVSSQVSNNAKFYAATGWRPKYTLEESIDWLLKTWRANVAQGC
jgi:nucleoside-diphosphate-sugar epimerase